MAAAPTLPPGYQLDVPSGPPAGYQLDSHATSGNAYRDFAGGQAPPEEPTSGVEGALNEFPHKVAQNLANAPSTIWNMVRHPIDTFMADQAVRDKYYDAGKASIDNGEYVKGILQGGASAVPFIGPIVGKMVEGAHSGDWNQVADSAADLYSMEVLAKVAKAAPELATDPAVQAAAARTAKAAGSGIAGGLKGSVSMVDTTGLPWRIGTAAKALGITKFPATIAGAAGGSLIGRAFPIPYAADAGMVLGALFPTLKGIWDGAKDSWDANAPQPAQTPSVQTPVATPGQPQLAAGPRVIVPEAPPDISGAQPFTPPEAWNQKPAAAAAPVVDEVSDLSDGIARGYGYKDLADAAKKDPRAAITIQTQASRIANETRVQAKPEAPQPATPIETPATPVEPHPAHSQASVDLAGRVARYVDKQFPEVMPEDLSKLRETNPVEFQHQFEQIARATGSKGYSPSEGSTAMDQFEEAFARLKGQKASPKAPETNDLTDLLQRSVARLPKKNVADLIK